MHSKLAILALPALAAAYPQSSAVAPAPEQITIRDTTYSGSGCPQGSVSTSTSDDKTVSQTIHFTLLFIMVSMHENELRDHLTRRSYGFDQFQTYIGPGSKASDKSKNCQLHLNLAYPGGFQYAVVDATYHGWARLDEGVTGSFITTYYFSQDAGKTQTTRSSFNGGGALLNGQVYTKQDSVETTATIWSPCGSNGILNINNRIALTSKNTTASGELSNDDATVAFTQQLHVAWKKCTPTSGGGSGSGNGDAVIIGTPNSDVIIG
ncbi:hypothetical protein HBH56_206490 [Parastagonospora nodorum]|nr:hypothetical protein HBH56_206490 [Parastagonospora nodorum]KAH3923791.1 hypothetical protein HBH54_205360 [Parastagonospora nodorum]KAH3962322.1 hypothetical protein HBH51_176780 [Parastagonospora nodorum]KAH3992989.1 hypothetical protein HBI10_208220 [Parastagonospora nodorum]KAH4010821.1 hypothetical protein HBI13_203230 [Parastagonospora nodorum]